jgi:hypothetical protein
LRARSFALFINRAESNGRNATTKPTTHDWR